MQISNAGMSLAPRLVPAPPVVGVMDDLFAPPSPGAPHETGGVMTYDRLTGDPGSVDRSVDDMPESDGPTPVSARRGG